MSVYKSNGEGILKMYFCAILTSLKDVIVFCSARKYALPPCYHYCFGCNSNFGELAIFHFQDRTWALDDIAEDCLKFPRPSCRLRLMFSGSP